MIFAAYKCKEKGPNGIRPVTAKGFVKNTGEYHSRPKLQFL